MPILFNQIPGSGLVAPGFFFEFNPAGYYSSVSRLLLIGHKVTAGTIAANTPTVVASQNDCDRLAGAGSMLREMFRVARQNAPLQEIWIEHVAESGAADTRTLTVAAGATGTAGTGTLIIQGETVQVPISASDTTTIVAASIASAISAYFNPLTGAALQYTATSSSAIATATCRHAGSIFADTDFYIPPISGNLFTSANLTIATGTAGTGQPTLTSALAALGDDNYDFIVSPWSDSTSTAAYAALTNDTSGRWSYPRNSLGHVWCVATGGLSTLQTLGLALNDRHLTVLGRTTASVTPSHIFVAGWAARRAAWLSDYATGNVSRNATGAVVQGLQGPRDRSTWFGYVSRNSLVQSGISTFLNNSDGSLAVDKEVTTYQLGTSGQPDATYRDVQTMYQNMHVERIQKTNLQNQFGQRGLADSNPGGLGAIVTPKDIAASLVNTYQQLAVQGLVENTPGYVANLAVARNASNRNRVDVYNPIQLVRPLDVMAINTTTYVGVLPAAN